MRILAIAADITPEKLGGAEMHFVEVLKRVAPDLEAVTVVTGPEITIKKEFPGLSHINYYRVIYPHIPNLYGIMFILFAAPLSIVLAKLKKYDLVWAKQEFPQAQVGALVKKFTGIPLYITSQNPLLAREELVLRGWLPMKLRAELADLITPLIAWSFRKADTVAAVSSYSAKITQRMGARNIVIIPNGVDIEKFRPVRNSEDKLLEIVTTSSLIPRNGIDILIKACALLPAGLKWKLTIAGEGPLFKQLQKMARSLRIADRVTFLGRVSNKDIPALLSRSSVFIRPSRHEGFGSSFIEAMAVGLPVIGTPVGGITDFLTDRRTGLLVLPNDPKDLAKAIEKLARDKNLRLALGDNGAELARTKYHWGRIAVMVLREFRNLSDEKK